MANGGYNWTYATVGNSYKIEIFYRGSKVSETTTGQLTDKYIIPKISAQIYDFTIKLKRIGGVSDTINLIITSPNSTSSPILVRDELRFEAHQNGTYQVKAQSPELTLNATALDVNTNNRIFSLRVVNASWLASELVKLESEIQELKNQFPALAKSSELQKLNQTVVTMSGNLSGRLDAQNHILKTLESNVSNQSSLLYTAIALAAVATGLGAFSTASILRRRKELENLLAEIQEDVVAE
jgi:hypothetical protein